MKINDDSSFDDLELLVRGGASPFASKRWVKIPLAHVTAIELKRSWAGVIGDFLLCVAGLILIGSLPGQYVSLHTDATGLALIALGITIVILFNAVRSFFVNWVLLVSTAEGQFEVGANSDRSHGKATALKDQLLIAIQRAIARERS